MKITKIIVFTVIFALMLSLAGCDIASMLGGDDTTLDGDQSIGRDDDRNENEEPGDDDDGVTDHVCDFKLQSQKPASCTAEGEEIYKCSCGKTDKKTLEKTEHMETVLPATDATDKEPAKTEGKVCTVCGTVTVKQEYIFVGDYSVAEKYDGDYAYNSLLKLPKSEKLTKLYNDIDKLADEFHSGNVNASQSDKYVFAKIRYSDYGLTADEAIAVWCAYRIDRPLYYWFSNNISYTDDDMNISCEDVYADASVRAALNSQIYAGVEKYVKEAYSQSIYNTALAFHDFIIRDIDYAYEVDGVTPEDDAWAHNIIGVFNKGAGVCEAYSKTFQLLLNYCDIENVIVSGWANEAHAWNLIKLDDGNWYWCDLTWDDTPEFAWGISYRYFCVNDSDNVGWMDGPFNVAPQTFMSSHIPYNKVDTGIDYNYSLPTRSVTPFTSADIMLRDTFDVGNLTYAIAGHNSAQLVSINSDGDVTIPSTVSYKGKVFDVISIGKMDGKRFTVGSIAAYLVGVYTEQYNVGSVTIPDSVIFIWDDAFNIDSLYNISVDTENLSFASVDGVLFTKDLGVLIKYPTAKDGKEYTLPTATRKIAAGAFSTLYSNTGDKLKLEKIHLSSNILGAGVSNYGYGYTDARYFEDTPWDNIRAVLSGEAVVYDKDGKVFNQR